MTSLFVIERILDQHILIGADEGIYTLNLNELHESTMELVSSFQTISLYLWTEAHITSTYDIYSHKTRTADVAHALTT